MGKGEVKTIQQRLTWYLWLLVRPVRFLVCCLNTKGSVTVSGAGHLFRDERFTFYIVLFPGVVLLATYYSLTGAFAKACLAAHTYLQYDRLDQINDNGS